MMINKLFKNLNKYAFKNNLAEKFLKSLNRSFTTTPLANNNQLYIWFSNVGMGRRSDDLKNRLALSSEPKVVPFFNDKSPVYVYMGPRHSGVVTEDGSLYTFGTGNWGVLGHGNEDSVDFSKPKRVDYFSKNNIKIKKVCMGDFHTIALSDKGEVYTWGFGGRKGLFQFLASDYGALGHGDKVHTFVPKKVKYFENNKVKIKDIASGIRHSVALSDDGYVYTWGKGEFGLLGNGSNKDAALPIKNEYLEMYKTENPKHSVVKIDCADEYTAALTEDGNVYVWGKNNQGQLGMGSGIGVDFYESEKFPVLNQKPKDTIFTDFSCGENTMMMSDTKGILYKTGWRLDYVPNIISMSQHIKHKMFFCGNSYYCMIDTEGNVYQWGNLFKANKTDKTDSDMYMLKEKLFDGKEILLISGKFKLCGALVKAP
jgi:alpha-tubulin suppressor-like RCC1 family protein